LDKALVLAPEAPYPQTGGGALRTASLLEYLARRYEVDIITFRQPGERIDFPAGIANRVDIIDLPAHARSTPARLIRNSVRLMRRVPPLLDRFAGYAGRIQDMLRARTYELALVEHFWCAPYHEQVAAVSRRTALDLHNIESVLHQGCAQSEPWPASFAHRSFQRASLDSERRWLPRYSHLLVTSEADAVRVRQIWPDARPIVYPNAIPLVPLPRVAKQDVIVFSGNMEYHPNTSAVRFFRREIWPALRERWPSLIWRLAGKNPHAVRPYTTGDPRIEVTGPMEDAIAAIAPAKVAVAPLLAGSGTRLKILEAWAAGTAVVSTTIGAEGLEARDGEHLVLADGAAQFAGAVSNVLTAGEFRLKLAAAGRALYERRYTWEAAGARLAL
jgi:glycosyltransferase involved in cell wall biosynthesis